MKNSNNFNKFELKDDENEYQKQLQRVMQDDDFEIQGPLITEEEESEIRQVASDINEKAFYGKILKTKQALGSNTQISKLSPRS